MWHGSFEINRRDHSSRRADVTKSFAYDTIGTQLKKKFFFFFEHHYVVSSFTAIKKKKNTVTASSPVSQHTHTHTQNQNNNKPLGYQKLCSVEFSFLRLLLLPRLHTWLVSRFHNSDFPALAYVVVVADSKLDFASDVSAGRRARPPLLLLMMRSEEKVKGENRAHLARNAEMDL